MAHITASVLGPLRVNRGDNDVNLGSPQQQAMFAALLMRPGRSATAVDLVEALWGEEGPASAVTTLRTYAWRLRKALEANGAYPRILQSVGDGYQLELPDDHVDYRRAEEYARAAELARREDKPARAYEAIEAALLLWQGEPLAAVPGPFAASQRRRLNELRLSLMEERIDVGLELGLSSSYVAELHSLIDQHPLRERLYCLLMRAQSLAGRRAEALATYRDARRVLIDELGVEAGPELTDLHQRILSGDKELVPERRGESVAKPKPAPAAPPADASESVLTERAAGDDPPARREPPRQLPPQPCDFLGRSHLATTLASALTVEKRFAPPVVVLVGMGGVGKSALALHVAHHISEAYPDGQLYAELRSGDGDAVRPEIVLGAFLTALGVRQDQIPESLQERSALFRTMVGHRRMLIVLDDAQWAGQVCPLLPGEANCGVLITSRTRLSGLPAALQTELGVFHPSEAVDLMARIIGSERVKAEPEATLKLMESCGFLPLAVRIVAARLAARPTWSIESLVVRLSDERKRIDELRVGDMTIAAAFDLTFRQLSRTQAHGLCLVSSIAAPELSLSSAAAALDVDEGTAEALLESLVDAAMLESPSAGRYRFHSLLRSFARHRRLPGTELLAVRRLLDSLLATTVHAFGQVVVGDPVQDTLARSSKPGIRFTTVAEARAWAMAEAETVLSLAAQVARGVRTGSLSGGEDDFPDSLLRSAIDMLIAFSAFQADVGVAAWAEVTELLTATAERCSDNQAEGRARFLEGTIALAMGRFARAREQATTAIRLCRASGDLVILQQVLNDLGLETHMRGDLENALHHYQEAIVLSRRMGHRAGEITTRLNSALLYVNKGVLGEALCICEEVLSKGADLSHSAEAYAYYILGLARYAGGDFREAAEWQEKALALCLAARLPVREAQVRFRLADALRELGELDRAVEEAERSVVLCEQAGNLRHHHLALLVLGHVHVALGHLDEARTHLVRAHESLAALGVPEAERAAALLTRLERNFAGSGRVPV
ncbi:AfsR/SARP family transcriptional regulator [Streptomyces tendae]|uniref:OmpR/PhoB-type domain-containing protein n=1 Tax=Streptomyces tendae TaxID=1932 RepID=A0ABX6A0I7_STRTE|nr:BTAD domain-containing putative transcriptional regulator [Streptomyces tendae]QER90449.1 hypothetical protein F3L20_32795 [Streptomyces tendae]